MYNQLSALSPLDGRYGNSVKDLAAYFSEAALMRYRLYIEIEYLIALSYEKQIKDLPIFHSGPSIIKEIVNTVVMFFLKD